MKVPSERDLKEDLVLLTSAWRQTGHKTGRANFVGMDVPGMGLNWNPVCCSLPFSCIWIQPFEGEQGRIPAPRCLQHEKKGQRGAEFDVSAALCLFTSRSFSEGFC